MTAASSLPSFLALLLLSAASAPAADAFVAPLPSLAFRPSPAAVAAASAAARLSPLHMGYEVADELFEDDEEMVEVAANYVASKYKMSASDHGHSSMTKDDCREVLRSILPPVTSEELDDEVAKTLELIMRNPENSEDKINQDCFVDAVLQNTYWQSAGSLVVKELMYFDALYHYYRTGKSLLNDDDYEALKENLTWEGSSVATMNRNEAMFVNAVASSRRGEAFMDDAEYAELKNGLKSAGSWVTARKADALEKLGLNTFMGYLHRAL